MAVNGGETCGSTSLRATEGCARSYGPELRAAHGLPRAEVEGVLNEPDAVAVAYQPIISLTTGAVVGEFIGSRFGLGAMINVARGFFDVPLIFVALLCLGLITGLFSSLIIALERLLVSWQD